MHVAHTKDERRELRADWYPRLARNDKERERYMARLDSPPPPFADLRRPDEHRTGWTGKRDKAKNAKVSDFRK